MGQQQLLLLVLGIVIVGIAVVAGIQAFSEGKAKAAQDAAVSDAMRIISDVQAWKLKPGAFGGGGDKAATNFKDVSLKALGYPIGGDGAVYVTVNGCYKLVGSESNATLGIYALSGDPEGADSVGTAATSCGENSIAQVKVKGAGTKDISWSYDTPAAQ